MRDPDYVADGAAATAFREPGRRRDSSADNRAFTEAIRHAGLCVMRAWSIRRRGAVALIDLPPTGMASNGGCPLRAAREAHRPSIRLG